MTTGSDRATETDSQEDPSAVSGEQECLATGSVHSKTRIGELVGVLAHQVRNPLGAIKNAAYLVNLTLGPSAPAEVSQAVAIIHDEVHRANAIITGLLDLVRVRPPARRPTALAYLIEQALGGLSPSAGTVIERAFDDDLVVDVDPDQTQRAIFHVCRHALDQSVRGATLRVDTCALDRRARITVRDGAFDEATVDELHGAWAGPSPDLSMAPLTAKVLIENQGGTVLIDHRGRSLRVEIFLPLATGA